MEAHIQFDEPRAESVLYCLDLKNFNARSDIQAYLKREFGRIYGEDQQIMQEIPQPWPSPQDFSVLLNKTGSSFALATILVQLVESSLMPDEAMKKVLSSEYEITTENLIHQQGRSNALREI